MSTKSKKTCKYPVCAKLTDIRYCEDHRIQELKERPSAYKRGYITNGGRPARYS